MKDKQNHRRWSLTIPFLLAALPLAHVSLADTPCGALETSWDPAEGISASGTGPTRTKATKAAIDALLAQVIAADPGDISCEVETCVEIPYAPWSCESTPLGHLFLGTDIYGDNGGAEVVTVTENLLTGEWTVVVQTTADGGWYGFICDDCGDSPPNHPL